MSLRMWLCDFLPKRLPNARILLFGYNSNVAIETSAAGVNEQAVNLLDRFNAQRRQVDPHRPIIFIAHSLGGIVVKRALVEAKLNDKYASIRKATFGLVFFATPHRGGRHAQLGDIAADIARCILRNQKNTFMDNLKYNSLFSEHLQDEFRHQYEDYQILSFYETLPMGPLGLIVDKQSATLGLSGQRETAIALDGDHRSICKFPEPNSAYQQVEDDLVALVEEALQTPVQKSSQTSNVQSPTFFVPYQKNSSFVGREKIIARLIEILSPHPGWQRRAALYGLGGIGKTQIALSYAHWCRETHPKTSVFWIHASNLERFHQSYMDLAEELKIPGADSPKADILSLVKNWLSIKKDSEDWLMIVDNADDFDMFFKSSNAEGKRSFSGRLADYIPDCAHGAVLLTTRDKKVGIGMVKMSSLLQVKRMADMEAIGLVRKILEDEDEYKKEDITQLANKLEYIPLALTQAAAFIWENTLSIQRYLQRYEESRLNALKLLGHSAASTMAEDEARNAVTTTWMMSFTRIKEQNRLAADILSLLAFLDRHCVPDELIRRRDQSLLDIDFEKACGLLKRFSLVEESPLTLRGETHAAFSLHRMVQLVTQQWLQSHGEAAIWAEQALVAVSIVFPPGEREEWKSCEIYLPHVEVVLENKVQSEDGRVSTSKAALLHNAATYFRVKGYHGRAEETASEAVAVRKASLGACHPDTLASHTSLSRILLEQGKIEEAMALQLQAVATAKQSVPEDNPDLLRAVAHLGSLHGIQGRYEEAERLQGRVLEVSKRTQGLNHPDTLLTMRDLAITYGHLRRYDEAETLNKLVLERRQQVLGEDHPETLISMLDLAATYVRQNSDQKAEMAEEIELQVIEARKRVLGEEHPATIQAMKQLCETYEWQGRQKDLAKLQEQIKAIDRRGGQKTKKPSDAALLTMSHDILTYELPLRSNQTRRMSSDECTAVGSAEKEDKEVRPTMRIVKSSVDLKHEVNNAVSTVAFVEQVEMPASNMNKGHHHTQSVSSSASLLSPAYVPPHEQAKRTRSSIPGMRSRWKSWQGGVVEEPGEVVEKPRKRVWSLRH
ncbi:uncharacterized protein A1O5_13021 [Cladophialophora psammophila CBS 110553]|uniref:DUF676 domain-containing protein n=1 Tax=Cladophialophora psammophila CBS 110553 TaxID=1182543 RepID=W9VDS4_9EURO|nr:uncharacterized protein A1O5_13021 [Cladophialophora psammophila CBS 110553]EXJ53772.1 hypothetical protein A1O5_13021 [Cladophialophora psammophila CBS 110553]